MGWYPNANIRSFSPHGIKESEGFVQGAGRNSAEAGMPAGLPTAGQRTPSPVFERSLRGAGRGLTSGTPDARLQWGANCGPNGRK
jgi:hypothetical protein